MHSEYTANGPPQRPCILIVDDNEVIRASLWRLFSRNSKVGVCYEAKDGRDAIEKALLYRPDLIILDMSMPGMDGIQTAKRISLISPTIPIILFTLHSDALTGSVPPIRGVAAVVSKMAADELVQQAEKILAI